MTAAGPLQRVAKHIVEAAAGSSLARALARPRIAGRVLILAYHNILDGGASPRGEHSLHLAFDDYRRQLDHLSRNARVIALDLALDSPPDGPVVAITFDDAYRGALSSGLAEASARGLPASVFVAPGLLGTPIPWWDAVANSITGEIDPAIRSHLLEAMSGDAARVLKWAAARDVRLQTGERTTRIGTEAELAEAVRLPGVSLGAHSWGHPSLPDTPADLLSSEFTKPLEWLRARYPKVLPVIAYPYGRTSAAVRHKAREAGYVAGLGISGGWFRATTADPMLIPRLNVPAGLTLDGFAARVNGVLA
jgi:peptidoglycan/xylan/chitin deacetylase (PgdA/CDA1 family)